jgi:hypothetical protein
MNEYPISPAKVAISKIITPVTIVDFFIASIPSSLYAKPQKYQGS